MKILTWDEADRWQGSPNFYLDEPPYLLEPGDVGYVPSDFIPRPPNPHPRPPLVRAEPWQPPEPIGPVTFATTPTKIHPFINPYTTMNIPGQMEFTFVVRLTSNGLSKAGRSSAHGRLRADSAAAGSAADWRRGVDGGAD